MARVKAFAVDGVRMWFWSNDHAPPHFHAASDDGSWEVAVQFLLRGAEMFERLRPPGARMRRVHRTGIIEGVERCRGALLIEWEAVREDQDP
jgi:hypothetical protein